VIAECVETVTNHSKQVKISMDGKKVNSSLSKESGDVNLFGFEESPTFQERNERLSKELKLLNDIVQHAETQELELCDLLSALRMISLRIKDLRHTECTKKASLKKLKDLGGPDWRQSKYVYVISGLQASLFEISETIKSSLDATDRLGSLCAGLNGVSYCLGSEPIDVKHQDNYLEISSCDENCTEAASNVTRCLVKQRSSKWFELRKTCRVTGSQVNRAVGLDTFKQQVNRSNSLVRKLPQLQQKCGIALSGVA
jgi:hypothetical protein